MSFLGIICASISSGLGEVTFLSYSSGFHRRVVSGWSSGTGAAGLLGAGAYALLTLILSPRQTLLVMLLAPVMLTVTFRFLIIHPTRADGLEAVATRPLLDRLESTINTNESSISLAIESQLTFHDKLALVKPLFFRFMLPLALVYFFEYFINQGLFELLYFSNTKIAHKDQYRWYQVLYQLGVFVSRSSVGLVEINKLWLLPAIQGANCVLFLAHVISPYIPNIYIVFLIVIFEGLMGGGAYVNTFNTIAKEVS